jgi:uncharacterized protein YbjT (DUF2867 family)
MSTQKKIAVVGATGRVGRHLVDILEAQGHEVAAIARSRGVDVITGEGLDEALSGAEVAIDAATGPSPEEQAATEFFTTAARNLHAAGERAGVRRLIVVSIIGTDRFSGGYGAAKVAHERAALAGPIPARVVRAAQFHELVAQLMEWGARDGATYVPRMRTQLVAARTVAEALADVATGPDTGNGGPMVEVAGPREERLVEMAALLAARRGEAAPIEAPSDPDDPVQVAYASGGLLPGPGAILAGPTFAEWLEAAWSASPRRSSPPAIHGSPTGSSARRASQRCASSAP